MSAPTGALRQVRVADVCAHGVVVGGELLGVGRPTSASVVAVDLVTAPNVLGTLLTERGVAVLNLETYSGPGDGQYLIDVLMRRAQAARASMVLVVGSATPVSAATRRLAITLQLPTLIAPRGSTAVNLVVELRAFVSAPDLEASKALLHLVRGLRSDPGTLASILPMVSTSLGGANVYAVTAEGVLLEGVPEFTNASEVVSHASTARLEGDSFGALLLPVPGLTGAISLWLVAERAQVGRVWLDTAESALALASGHVLAWLARQQAEIDRDARLSSALLTEIIEHPDNIPRSIAETAIHAGWNLSGWHTGMHFRTRQGTSMSALSVQTLSRQISSAGLPVNPLVERTDGWSTWLTSVTEPGPDFARKLAKTIELGVLPPAVEGGIAVGIGSPKRDVRGIAVTLAEARQAAVIAASSTKPFPIRVIQELGPSRLLLGWYSSSAFADYASEMLGPLLDTGDTELIRTLEAYLERACSTTQTARALGLHRNTVLQRITRAERILGTTLAAADTRLALQLALRVNRMSSED